jgi:ABC-type uncharacterized transport system substrate-binding protein
MVMVMNANNNVGRKEKIMATTITTGITAIITITTTTPTPTASWSWP